MGKNTYVALLRGINVGGNNKVEMPKLKISLEIVGLSSVITYINSGNLIFVSDKSIADLTKLVEEAIERDFGLQIKVIIRDRDNITRIVESVPSSWLNNSEQKTDVMFLWPEVDSKQTLRLLNINPQLEDANYNAGAIVWRIGRSDIPKSKATKIVGTKLYSQMTIRNINTLRKLHEIMNSVS